MASTNEIFTPEQYRVYLPQQGGATTTAPQPQPRPAAPKGGSLADEVIALAQAHGWSVHRHIDFEGFPSILCCKAGHPLRFFTPMQGTKQPSMAQRHWHILLNRCEGSVAAFIWRKDLPLLREIWAWSR